MFFVLGLGIFHLFLKCTGKTTREYLKKKDKVTSYAFVDNDWCRSTPSFLDFGYKINENTVNALKNYKYNPGDNIDFFVNNNNPIEINKISISENTPKTKAINSNLQNQNI